LLKPTTGVVISAFFLTFLQSWLAGVA